MCVPQATFQPIRITISSRFDRRKDGSVKTCEHFICLWEIIRHVVQHNHRHPQFPKNECIPKLAEKVCPILSCLEPAAVFPVHAASLIASFIDFVLNFLSVYTEMAVMASLNGLHSVGDTNHILFFSLRNWICVPPLKNISFRNGMYSIQYSIMIWGMSLEQHKGEQLQMSLL